MRTIFLAFLLLQLGPEVYSQSPSAIKYCGDDRCENVLFEGLAERDYDTSHEDFISFKTGDPIKVTGIEFSDRPDLWEGQYGDKKGFFYKNHINHGGYLEFLRESVAEDKTLYTLLRDRRLSPGQKRHIGQASAKRVLEKLLGIEMQLMEEKLREARGEGPEVENSSPQEEAEVPKPKPGGLRNVLRHSHSHEGGNHGHSHGGEDHDHSHEEEENHSDGDIHGHGHSHGGQNGGKDHGNVEVTSPPPVPTPSIPPANQQHPTTNPSLPTHNQPHAKVEQPSQPMPVTVPPTNIPRQNPQEVHRQQAQIVIPGPELKVHDSAPTEKKRSQEEPVDDTISERLDNNGDEEKLNESTSTNNTPPPLPNSASLNDEKVAETLSDEEIIAAMEAKDIEAYEKQLQILRNSGVNVDGTEENKLNVESSSGGNDGDIDFLNDLDKMGDMNLDNVLQNTEKSIPNEQNSDEKSGETETTEDGGEDMQHDSLEKRNAKSVFVDLPAEQAVYEATPLPEGAFEENNNETVEDMATTTVAPVVKTTLATVITTTAAPVVTSTLASVTTTTATPVTQSPTMVPVATTISQTTPAPTMAQVTINPVTQAPVTTTTTTQSAPPMSTPAIVSTTPVPSVTRPTLPPMNIDSPIEVVTNRFDVGTDKVADEDSSQKAEEPETEIAADNTPSETTPHAETTVDPATTEHHHAVTPQERKGEKKLEEAAESGEQLHAVETETPAPSAEEETATTLVPQVEDTLPPTNEQPSIPTNTEIKEFGNDYCIKEDCDHDHDKVKGSHVVEEVLRPDDELPDLSHIPPEGIDVPPMETIKQTSLMDNARAVFAPFVRVLKSVCGGIRYSLPKEIREEFGDSGILMLFLFVVTLFVHLIMGLLESSSAKKQRVDLSRFYNLGSEKRVLEVENEQLKKKHFDTSSADEEVKGRLKDLESERGTMEREINRLQKELETRNLECEKSSGELIELKTSLQTAENAKEALDKDCEAKNAELDRLREKEKGIEAELKEYRRECEASRGKADELERKVGNLESSLETTQSRNKELEAQREEIQAENQILSQKLETETEKVTELETHVHGLKSIVEQFQGATPAEVDSGGSGGWSDIGGDFEDPDHKRKKLAELTNAAQLVGKLKKAEAETGRVKELLQKETEEKLKLESKLESIRYDLTTLREKLDRTEKERSDVVGQVIQLTSMIRTKDEDLRGKIEELEKKLDKARAETERVQEEAEMYKQQKASWEQKFKDRDEDFLRKRTELDKAETRFYHEIREKEEKTRKLQIENSQLKSQLRMNVSLNHSSHAAISPTSNNSSEAEMMNIGGGHQRGGGPSPFEPSNWAFIPPSATPASYSGPWDDPRYDSPPSSGDYYDRRTRPKSKTRETGGEERRRHRSHSRGAPKSSQREQSPVLEKGKETRRSVRRPPQQQHYGPSPSFEFGFHPAGFDPYYGGPSDHYLSSGPSPPPQLPLLSGVAPPGIKGPAVSKQRPKSAAEKENGKKGRRKTRD